MINNFDLISPLLEFKDKGDFYTILILKRKKDFNTEKSNHPSVRIIKTYTVYSLDYLIDKKQEIFGLCEFFKARAYINLNVKNDSTVLIHLLRELTNRLESGDTNCTNIYNSVVGNLPTKRNKKWIIDIDEDSVKLKEEIKEHINSLEPIGNKLILEIPTKSGFHLITSPFRFDKYEYQGLTDIQKNNPTLLYFPSCLITL